LRYLFGFAKLSIFLGGFDLLRIKFTWFLPVVLAFVGLLDMSWAQEIVRFSNADGKRIYSNTEEIYRLLPPEKPKEIPQLLSLDGKSGPSPQIEQWISDISEQHGVDPELVKVVAKVESNFNRRAVSNRGAMGLMQLIPDTARRFGVSNVFDPRQSIEGGVKYLKFLSGMFPDNLPHVLAAYNAGENAVVKYKGVPPYRETQAYVRKITAVYNKKGNFLVASNRADSDRRIVSYRDRAGRIIYSNLDSAYR
jgi:soluble lytic murein transglycosylase-like protein